MDVREIAKQFAEDAWDGFDLAPIDVNRIRALAASATPPGDQEKER